MNATALLTEVEIAGAQVGLDRGRLYVEPASRIPPTLLRELRQRRQALLAVLLIREALDGGTRLTGLQLSDITGLPREVLYSALGDLYHSGDLRTDPSGVYWLAEAN